MNFTYLIPPHGNPDHRNNHCAHPIGNKPQSSRNPEYVLKAIPTPTPPQKEINLNVQEEMETPQTYQEEATPSKEEVDPQGEAFP